MGRSSLAQVGINRPPDQHSDRRSSLSTQSAEPRELCIGKVYVRSLHQGRSFPANAIIHTYTHLIKLYLIRRFNALRSPAHHLSNSGDHHSNRT